MFSKPRKLSSSSHMKSHVSLSHVKTRQAYDFSLYFPHKLLLNFLNIYNVGMYNVI